MPFEHYVYRRPNGCWEVGHPIAAKAAAKHLGSLGIEPQQVANILKADLHEIAHGIECEPTEPASFERDGRRFLNNFVPSAIVPAAGGWARIRNIMQVITEQDTKGFEWLFNWMAAKVQNPGARSLTAPVFQGLQGTGKSTLGVILGHIIGIENTASITQDDLDAAFNLHYVTKLLVLADEVVNRDNIRSTESKLKKFITDPQIIANGKNTPQFPVKNHMSWWFTSNVSTPVRVEGEHDRRYTVFCCSTPPSTEYKAMLKGLYLPTREFTPEALVEIGAFADALMNHVVDLDLATRPFQNAARAELAAASRSSTEAFFEEVAALGIDVLIIEARQADPSPTSNAWDYKDQGVTVDGVYEAYRHFAAENGFNALVAKQTLGKDLRMRHPKWLKTRSPTGSRPYVYQGLPRSSK